MKITMFKQRLSEIMERTFLKEEGDPFKHCSEEQLLISHIRKAHQEWLHASKYFNAITDPDLVDYAALSIKTAEKKYVYLLKKAREMNLTQEVQVKQNSDRDLEQPIKANFHLKSS